MIFDIPIGNIVFAIALMPVFIAPAVLGVWFRAGIQGRKILYTLFQLTYIGVFGVVGIAQSVLCKTGHGSGDLHEIHANVFASIFVSECIITISLIFFILFTKRPRA